MGTRLRIRVAASDRGAGIRATERAFDAVRSAESLLSTWRVDTELGRLNRAPVGDPVVVSRELTRLLEEARRWARQTGGAFEPVVGALVEAWGLRGAGHNPSDEALARAVAATGPGALSLNGERGTAVRADSLAWIDAGAFGKGYALRRARRALKRAGISHAVLDFGGQILTLGRPSPDGDDPTGGAWTIPVAHPDRRSHPVVALTVPGGKSVSTTSGSERFVAPEGRVLSHVIDPRSGRPVRPWGSVTVVAEDPMVADLISTALFVLGPDEALAWAGDREDVAVLVLAATEDPAGQGDQSDPPAVRARWTPAMEPHLVGGSVSTSDGRPVSQADGRPAGP